MKKKLSILFFVAISFIFINQNIIADSAFGSLVSLPGDDGSSGKKKDLGPMTITSKSMDIDIKNNIITLVGNVKVEDNTSKITSDKMLVYLQDKKDSSSSTTSSSTGSKSAKAIVALGDVVIIQKMINPEDAKNGDRKATAGRADYDTLNGIIILTDNPILYQGDSYIKGNRIILWKDSDRMKVESNEAANGSSIIVLNQAHSTDTKRDTSSK